MQPAMCFKTFVVKISIYHNLAKILSTEILEI